MQYEQFTPLHEACRDGDINKVKQIFLEDPNFLSSLSSPVSPLVWASKCGHTEVVKFLIDNYSPLSSSTASPLHQAAIAGHLEVVKILLENGANIQQIITGQTPLCVAADSGNLEIVKFLIEKGAEVNTWGESSPLLNATIRGYTDIMKYLISKGAYTNDAYILASAVFHGKYHAVELLLQNKINVDSMVDERTALTLAVKDNRKEITKLLLDYGASPHAKILGDPVIYVAAVAGYIEITKLLLQHGAKANHWCPAYQTTPFYQVCTTQRDIKMIELLWQYGGCIEGVEGRESPLIVAIQNECWEVAEFLVDHDADVNRCAKNFLSPLQMVCAVNTTEALLLAKRLVNHGADVNYVRKLDKDVKATPLYFAVEKNFAEMVWLLVFSGADVNWEIEEESGKRVWDLPSIDEPTYKALIHFWEPSTHFRHPKKVRDAIYCTLLVSKRLEWEFDDLLMHRLFSFIAYGWI